MATAKLAKAGRTCGFGLKGGECGKPAVATVGNTPLCLEHFEYASELMPVECKLDRGGKLGTVGKAAFMDAVRGNEQNHG